MSKPAKLLRSTSRSLARGSLWSLKASAKVTNAAVKSTVAHMQQQQRKRRRATRSARGRRHAIIPMQDRQRKKAQIAKFQNLRRNNEELFTLSPTDFEDMVAELYNQMGHQAKCTARTGDEGVDVVIRARNGEKWIVQCKRWRSPIGASVVREFYGAMMDDKRGRANKGINHGRGWGFQSGFGVVKRETD